MSEPSISPTDEHGISAAQTIAETLVDGRPPRAVKEPGRLTRGAMVGRYIVLDILGRGGMGIVYAAYDPELDRKIALKLILPGRDDGVAARLRLQREAQAIAQLSHPNVVAVHDVGAVEDKVFIAMEFVDGKDLARWLVAEPRSPDVVLGLFEQAGRGLAAAHGAGLVHRDFKPENVLIGTDGRARVVDFGLVRRDENSMSAEAMNNSAELMEISQRHARSAPDLRLTDAGSMVGTPAYMSPEQFSGLSGDARADQFSFCISLYEGLYGERPFDGENPADLSYAVTQGIIRPPPAKHEVSARMRRVLLRGLAVEPDERFPGMEALLAALRKASAPRRHLWAIPAVLGGIGVATLALWDRSPTQEPCAAVGEPARALWSPQRQQSILKAFRATGRPYADATWDRVVPRLDDYIEEWTQTRQAVCRDHGDLEAAVRAEDPRHRCLDESLNEVSDLLLVFEQANATTVTEAVKMTNRISTVSRCAQFNTVDEHPVPREPELRAQVEDLRSELRRWNLRSIGGYDEKTSQEIIDLVRRGEALGYAPLNAEIIEYQSGQASNAGRLDEAVDLSNRAFEVALASRHDFSAFQSASGLIFLHGVQRREPVVAHRWARRAESLLQRMGNEPKGQVQVLSNEASVFTLEGKHDEAGILYDQALAVVRTMDDPFVLASVLNNIGAFHAEQRNLTLSASYLEEAATINAEVLGPTHPSALRTRANLGIIAVVNDRLDEGMEILESVLPVQESVFGASHPEVANTLESMASVLRKRGEHDRGIDLRQRILKIRETAHGRYGQPVLSTKLNMGGALLSAERPDEAYVLLEQTLADIEASPTPDVRLRVRALIDLCQAAISLDEAQPDREGHHDDAKRHAEALLGLCRSDDGCTSLLRAHSLVTIGDTRKHRGDMLGARSMYTEALEAPQPESQPGIHASAHFGLAQATLGVDRKVAVAHARRALSALESETKSPKDLVEEVEGWLKQHDPTRGPDAE